MPWEASYRPGDREEVDVMLANTSGSGSAAKQRPADHVRGIYAALQRAHM